jgi:hypothetical protein
MSRQFELFAVTTPPTRERRLTVLETVVARIAQNVRQPLTSIVTTAAAAKQSLEKSPLDLEAVKGMLDEIVGASFRASEVFESKRVLIREDDSTNKEGPGIISGPPFQFGKPRA